MMKTEIYDTYSPFADVLGYYLGILLTSVLLAFPIIVISWNLPPHRAVRSTLCRRGLVLFSVMVSYLSWHFTYKIFDVFESASGFAMLVFALFAAITAYLHCAFLLISHTLSDRWPKYLDYVIAFFVSVGLVQAYTLWPKLKSFYTYSAAEESIMAENVRRVAREEKTQCGGDDTFYNSSYCAILGKIVSTAKPNLVDYVLNDLVGNTILLNNKRVTETIRYDTEWVYNSATGRTESKTTPTRVVQIVRSPLLNLTDDLETYRDKRNRYEKVNFDIRERPGYEILGMVAFLLATALRIVKTSIELFGNLKKQ